MEPEWEIGTTKYNINGDVNLRMRMKFHCSLENGEHQMDGLSQN